MGRGTSWEEYPCQEKETNFILLNHQISQKKFQASSCKKLQMDIPHRELLQHRYRLLQPGQPSSAIFLWSWPAQWKSLLLGNPVIVSAFAPEQPHSARPCSESYVNIQLIAVMTFSGFESLTWITPNCLHYIFAFLLPKPGSVFMRLQNSRARQRAQEMSPCVPSDCTGYHLLYGCWFTLE